MQSRQRMDIKINCFPLNENIFGDHININKKPTLKNRVKLLVKQEIDRLIFYHVDCKI